MSFPQLFTPRSECPIFPCPFGDGSWQGSAQSPLSPSSGPPLIRQERERVRSTKGRSVPQDPHQVESRAPRCRKTRSPRTRIPLPETLTPRRVASCPSFPSKTVAGNHVVGPGTAQIERPDKGHRIGGISRGFREANVQLDVANRGRRREKQGRGRRSRDC